MTAALRRLSCLLVSPEPCVGQRAPRTYHAPMAGTGRRLTDSERTAQMRRIRKRDTKPELLVRQIAHALGFRFRLYRRDLPGSPDLVFPRLRKVIFVHGCFWHQHAGCRLARVPRSRPEYWLPKLARNVERDQQAAAALKASGWRILTLWECELRDAGLLRDRIQRFLLLDEDGA